MELDPWASLLIGGLLMFLMMSGLWVCQRIRGDAGVVDIGWAAGIGILALFYAAVTPGDPGRRWFIAGLGAIWSFRLAIYLGIRVFSRPEDGRYVQLRKKWGDQVQWKFFVFYQFQALLDVMFSIPFLIAMRKDAPLGSVWDYVGGSIWLVAVVGELTADWQLNRFRSDPNNKGKVCQSGLWRYSRHPNYFFEWLHWWAYVALAIGAPFGWVTVFGPIVMLLFLIFVTGIPATERHAVESRGEAYRAYQRTTSAFIPWFPRKDAP